MSSQVAKRYAKALFELAEEQDCLDPILGDLRSIRDLIAGSEEMAHFFATPVMGRDQRRALMDSIFGGRAHPLTKRFLDVLEDKRRTEAMVDIVAEYERRYRELKGILKVQISSFKALSEEEVGAIRGRLEKRFKKTIEADVAVDSSLLGGFTIRIGDLVLDHSIKYHLESLRHRIAGAR